MSVNGTHLPYFPIIISTSRGDGPGDASFTVTRMDLPQLHFEVAHSLKTQTNAPYYAQHTERLPWPVSAA